MKHLMMNSVAVLILLLPQLVSAQCVKGNCWDGLGAYVYPSGAKYDGTFRDGKIHGEGTLYFSNGNRYDGNWKNQYREGQGKMVFTNGDVYQGQFKKSRINGKGVMRFANGDHYEGNWQNDLQNGEGKYVYSDGDRYEGTFVEGKLHGQGTMFYKDGSRYAGQWKSNLKNGRGTFFKSNGKEVAGVWASGKFEGNSGSSSSQSTASTTTSNTRPTTSNTNTSNSTTASTASTSMQDCNNIFCQGGNGQFVYGDGSKWVGSFKDGVPEGKGICYYANGDKYVGYWKQHAPHGEGLMHYTSGRMTGAIWEYGKIVSELENPSDDLMAAETVVMDRDDKVKIWAVVVGVARYTHMPVLKYTDDDAYHIYAFLKSPEGGALPDNQIRVLIDEDATRMNIITAMRQTFLQADENDVVMLYFSGHGLPGSFLPVNFDGYNNKLQHEDVKQILSETKAKHKLCFADACHSGTLTAMRSPLDGTV